MQAQGPPQVALNQRDDRSRHPAERAEEASPRAQHARKEGEPTLRVQEGGENKDAQSEDSEDVERFFGPQ